MTAEIGIMQITEQVDALKSMAVNPLQRLVSPRLLAGVIVFPLLTALCDSYRHFRGLSRWRGVDGLEFGHLFRGDAGQD